MTDWGWIAAFSGNAALSLGLVIDRISAHAKKSEDRGAHMKTVDEMQKDITDNRSRIEALEAKGDGEREIMIRVEEKLSYVKTVADNTAKQVAKLSEQMLLHLGEHDGIQKRRRKGDL